MTYSYLTNGNVQNITYPSGHVVGYSYNLNGGVSALTLNAQPLVSGIAYFPFGPVESWATANSLSYSRTFNLDGLITSITYPATVHSYSYDAAGQVTTIADSASPSLSNQYSYDVQGRLASITKNNQTTTWWYDANGNRYLQDDGTAPLGYTYFSNRIYDRYQYNTYIQEAQYTHGNAGQRLAKNDISYAYDDSGRMIELRDNGVLVASYAYNGKGERVRKTTGSVTTDYVYDEGGQLIGEYTGSHSREYVWLNDVPVAMIETTSTTTEIYYLYVDHLNTPRFAADASGSGAWAVSAERPDWVGRWVEYLFVCLQQPYAIGRPPWT